MFGIFLRDILKLSFVGLVVLVMSSVALAQQPVIQSAQIPSTPEEIAQAVNSGSMALVADIGITSAKILSLDNRILTFKFSAKNKHSPISDVRYGVDIMQASVENGEIVVGKKLYTKVFEESIYIDSNEVISRSVKLNIPVFVSGPVVFKLKLGTEKGLPLATSQLGDAMIPVTASKRVALEKCVVSVIDKSGKQTNHPLTFGVDLEGTIERLTLACKLNNVDEQVSELKMRFDTYRRTEYSEPITTKEDIFSIKPEDEEITFPINVQASPQSYIVFAQIIAPDNSILGQQEFRYVVRGASGTVQSVALDKSSYKKGDMATVSLYVTGNADMFPGARAQQKSIKTKQEKVVNVVIEDVVSRVVCGTGDGVLDFKKAIMEIVAPIKNNCKSPIVSATISENGTLLDSQVFEFTNKLNKVHAPIEVNVVSQDNQGAHSSQGVNRSWLIIVIILIAILLLLFVFRKKSIINGVNSIIITFAVGVTLFGTGIQNVDAATYSLSFDFYNITIDGQVVPFNYYTIETNIDSNQCEQLSVSMEATVGACNNDPIDLTYTLNADNKVKSGGFGCGYGGPIVSVCTNSASVTKTGVSPGVRNGSWNFSVSASGNRVHDDFDNKNKNHSGSQSINVATCAAVNPVCGTSNGKKYDNKPILGLCDSGVASNVTGNGPWNWTCASGGKTISCEASNNNQITTTLLATLVANPNSGQTPLNSQLIAGYSGGSGDNVLYSFKCKADDLYSPKQLSNIYNCAYVPLGIHKASVQIYRGGNIAGAQASVNVTSAPAVCGNGIVETGEQCDGESYCNSSCQIVQQTSGSCGNAENSAACTAPNSNLCSSGVVSGVTKDEESQRWHWTCGGTSCSTVAYCSYQEQ